MMAHIDNFPFSKEMTAALLDGRKCCTSRSKKYGELGDTFNVEGEVFRIVDIVPELLSDITALYYRCEGCRTADEFIDLWKRLHRGVWNPDRVYYIHFLGHVRRLV